MIPSNKLEEFKNVLRAVDWGYQFAEGQAYHNGRESYNRAVEARAALVREFPDDVDLIYALWQRKGGDDAPH